MNPLTDFLFTITWFVLLIWAIRSMSRGWTTIRDVPKSGYSVQKRTVTKIPHPEMVDVETGDELLVVKFEEERRDPLLQSLENRITELNDSDDDDDGDVPAVVRR